MIPHHPEPTTADIEIAATGPTAWLKLNADDKPVSIVTPEAGAALLYEAKGLQNSISCLGQQLRLLITRITHVTNLDLILLFTVPAKSVFSKFPQPREPGPGK